MVTSAINRADTAVTKNTDCISFLQRTIENLGINATPKSLINNLKSFEKDGKIYNDSPKSQFGAVVYYRDGGIYINKEGYTSYLYASLIHEIFHDYKDVYNENLEAAMRKADSAWGPMSQIRNSITGLVARNCGGL